MEDTIRIYDNEIGISFKWKNQDSPLIQVIFRDIGFHLYVEEIEYFLEKVIASKSQKTCHSCQSKETCRSLLLHTPLHKVSLAVSRVELNQIEDLLEGTLFYANLNRYLNNLCNN